MHAWSIKVTSVRQRALPPQARKSRKYSNYRSTEEPPRPRRSLPSHLSGFLMGAILLGTTASASVLFGLAVSFRNLPNVHELRSYVPVATTHIFDANGELITSLHGEANREVISLNEVSPDLKRSLLAIEDSHFYAHKGINPVRIGRAVMGSFEGGLGAAGGGSTVTMQLVKNLFLQPERTISRKVAEAVLAVRIEQVFEKDEIFEMYLNQVYWGHNLYGIQTAAKSYFNKPASDLNLAEAALLAGILPAPESYSPFRNLDAAKHRQKLVLNRMAELDWITQEEAEAAFNQELKFGQITSFRAVAPPITDVIEAELKRLYGDEAVIRGGLRVQTTIDMDLQRKAQAAVNEGSSRLIALGRNSQQMALAAIDPRTGFVKALVGGAYAKRGQFNRATQAFRQTGSTFKPFVYYTALASGAYGPGSTLLDTPVSYPDSPRPYSPQNYDNSFYGAISLTRSLQLSRNVPTVKLAYELGIQNVINNARAAGIKSDMYPNLSTALGSSSISPLEMAAAYGAFANGGHRVDPILFLQVVDRNGQILYEADPQPKRLLNPNAVAELNRILQGVITSGTGTAAQLPDGRPVAGKTGTTSDFRDAWFIGYVPQLSTAIWIGNDNNSPMAYGTAGGGYVAPTWRQFMIEALKDVPPEPFPELPPSAPGS